MASGSFDSTRIDQTMLQQTSSPLHSSPSAGMINLLYQLSIVVSGDPHDSFGQPAATLEFPVATILQIEHEFLRRPLDQLDGVASAGLTSSIQRLIYEALRRTGLVLVSAAVHNFQHTAGSHSNLDHNVMSLFMLDMSTILSYSPSFAVFVLCSAGPFTSESLRQDVRRWLAVAANRTNLSSWQAARRLLESQFFYYPSLLDPRCARLWHECEPLLTPTPAALLADVQALQVADTNSTSRGGGGSGGGSSSGNSSSGGAGITTTPTGTTTSRP